ncbi:MAG: sulfite exporter TauE/SafE family protein [Mariprofundaceae bacterium]
MTEAELILIASGLLTGIIAGFAGGLLAGLAGLGGGLIYLPLFLFIMPATELPEGENIALHVMASLVAVSITSFFAARAHWQLAHISLPTLKVILPGMVVGATVGLWSTLHLPAAMVLLGLSLLNLWVAWDLGRQHHHIKTAQQVMPFASIPIGYCSGSLGIGGGTMLIPMLRQFLGLRFAVGTSALCGFLMVTLAIMVNVFFESNWFRLLDPNILFLMGTWLGIAAVIPYVTHIAARLHTKWPESVTTCWLRWLFLLMASGLMLAAMIEWSRYL